MTFVDYINIALALLTIGFGLFGFVNPRYTAQALDLESTKSTMGLSELRASAGGLFVFVGLACLLTNADWAYAMLGVAYAGASAGRTISIFVDKPPQPKATVWLAFEAIPAIWLIAVNWPG